LLRPCSILPTQEFVEAIELPFPEVALLLDPIARDQQRFVQKPAVISPSGFPPGNQANLLQYAQML